jgi:hypothetical protein
MRQASRIGKIALRFGEELSLEILETGEGFYIGTLKDGLPFSRESVEYYPTRARAEQALIRNTWTQRMVERVVNLSTLTGNCSRACVNL